MKQSEAAIRRAYEAYLRGATLKDVAEIAGYKATSSVRLAFDRLGLKRRKYEGKSRAKIKRWEAEFDRHVDFLNFVAEVDVRDDVPEHVKSVLKMRCCYNEKWATLDQKQIDELRGEAVLQGLKRGRFVWPRSYMEKL